MRKITISTGMRMMGSAFAASAIRIFPQGIQKLLVERFDSFGLKLQEVRVNNTPGRKCR